MSVLSRFGDDATPPRLADAGRDLVVRALIPALGLMGVGLVVGWLVVVPLAASTGEQNLNVVLQAGRNPTLDSVAQVSSAIGGVTGNAILCVLAVALIWVMSRRWWLAALPFIALQLHILVHIATSTLVGRERPDVPNLDVGQPTASFPSGHMGATTAQLLVVVLFLCHRIRNTVVRVVLIVVTSGYLIVLGWSRLYLGMHYLSDVIWGAINGVVCGLIAWLFLRRNPTTVSADPLGSGADPVAAAEPRSGVRVAGAGEGVHAVGSEAEGDRDEERLAHRQPADVVEGAVESPRAGRVVPDPGDH